MKFSGALWIGDPFILTDELRLWELCDQHSQNVHRSHICSSARRMMGICCGIKPFSPSWWTLYTDNKTSSWIRVLAPHIFLNKYIIKIFTEKEVHIFNRWNFKPLTLMCLLLWGFFLVLFQSCTVLLKKHVTRLPAFPHVMTENRSGSQVVN